MSAEIGMDTIAVGVVAGKLDAQASQINAIVGSIEGLIRSIQQAWVGPAAEEFVSWWHNQHRPALQRAHDSIAGLASSARNNVAAQQIASGASGAGAAAGGAAGVTTGITAAGVLSHSDSIMRRLNIPGKIIGFPGTVKTWHAIVGALANDKGAFSSGAQGLETLGTHVGSGVAHLPFGGVLHDTLHNDRVLGGLEKAGKGLGAASLVLGGAAVANNLGHVVDGVAHGDLADVGNNLSDGTSTLLKSLPVKTPTAYLVGVDVSIWTDVAKAGAQVDWSWNDLPPNPFSGDNLTQIWIPSFAAAGKETFADAVDAFL